MFGKNKKTFSKVCISQG